MLLSILAFSRLVTGLAASVRATFESFSTHQAAKNISPPARLILQSLLAAETFFLGQERTLRAFFAIRMTIVDHLRVTTVLGSIAWKVAGWWSCPTWQRRLQHSPTTRTRDIVKNSLFAAAAWAAMTQVGAIMVATFEAAATGTSANMLRLNVLVEHSESRSKWFELPFGGLTLGCLLFSGTAPLTTLMPATAQRGFAEAGTLRGVMCGFVADDFE